MEKTVFHFAGMPNDATVTVDGNWIEAAGEDVATKFQIFNENGRKTMLVNMDNVTYVEVINTCK